LRRRESVGSRWLLYIPAAGWNPPEMPDTRSSAKLRQGRLRTNLVGNVLWFVFRLSVGIWLTPYLIRNLGVAAYGLVPLATSLSTYVSVLTIALSGSIGRYVVIALARGERAEANRYFNTALFAGLGLAVCLFPIAGVISYLTPSFINVPAGQETGARLLLMATIVAFLITTIGATFGVASYARRRFDIRSAVDASALSMRVLVIVLLFSLLRPSLWQVGLAVLAGNLCYLAGHYWALRRLTPQLRIERATFDRTSLWELLATGGWLVVNQAGSLLFLNVDLLLVNVLAGAVAAGSYAPLLLWSRTLRSFSSVIVGIMAPTIVKLYGEHDQDRLVSTSCMVMKLMGLVLALPVGALCGLSRPLLHVWLGPEFESSGTLMWLIVGPLCVNLCVTPLFSVQLAANKVRAPGVVTVVMGAANICLAVVLARNVGWGMYGVAAASAIMLTLKNIVFTPWYAGRILQRPTWTFLAPLAWALAAGAGAALGGLALSSILPAYSWPHLLAAGLALALPYAALAFFVVMRQSERRAVLDIVRGKI